MSPLPETLPYASPKPKISLANAIRAPLLFWAGATVASCAGIFFSSYILNDYNSYLQRDGSFLIGAFIATVLFGCTFLFLALIISVIEWLKPTIRILTPLPFWLSMGALTGLASTLPQAIDATTWTHHIDDNGNLEMQGWGFTISHICYFTIPLLTIVLAIRRRNSHSTAEGVPAAPLQK